VGRIALCPVACDAGASLMASLGAAWLELARMTVFCIEARAGLPETAECVELPSVKEDDACCTLRGWSVRVVAATDFVGNAVLGSVAAAVVELARIATLALDEACVSLIAGSRTVGGRGGLKPG
jgi:hypothetical protein